MRRADFHYDLPAESIAQAPLGERGAGRLLAIDGGGGVPRDLRFADLPTLLAPGDLLVFNDTRVVPARLHGRKATGGAVEILLERILAGRRFLGQARASKAFRPGMAIVLPGGATATVRGHADDLIEFELDCDPAAYFDAHGEVPLPPYIERVAGEQDRDRYQTVYARDPGSVAAPTAGLHFDAAMLERLEGAGIEAAWLTLHVGAGTFQPVRAERLEDHRMHLERVQVPAAAVSAIAATRRRGGRVVAVGTTVVRSLETAARGGRLAPCEGETDLFIHPGFRFNVVDAMLTNFHLPESTLLMLVCAFAGRERVLAAYRHAVVQGYRFFSYGDATFVTPDPAALAPRQAR